MAADCAAQRIIIVRNDRYLMTLSSYECRWLSFWTTL